MKPPRLLAALLLAAVVGPALTHPPALGQPQTAAPEATATVDAGWAQLQRIATARPETVTYRARFEQKKFSPLLRDPIASRGLVQMAGGVARWDTEPPHATTVVMDGQTLSMYYPDQQTLEVYALGTQPGGAGLAAIATSPVPDLDVLREHFDLEAWRFTNDNRQLALTLVPRSDAVRDAIEDVQVDVDTATGHLHRFVLTDLDGEATELTFLDPEPDAQIDPASLEFDVPPGTTVVRPLDDAAP